MGSKFSRRSSSSSAIPAASLITMGSGSRSGSGSGSGSVGNGDLKIYLEACNLDPDVKKFDSTLHRHASSVISTLATLTPQDGLGGGYQVQSLSFDHLSQVAGCLMDMNQEVANYILKFKDDVWKNKELRSLVEDYFEYTVKTLDFFTSLDNCLTNARARQFIIDSALRSFEEELQMVNNGGDDVDIDVDASTKFSKTLKELKSFKEAGDPFGEEFFAMFDSVRKQQLQMLERLQQRRRKIDKKLKSVKVYKKVSSIIFVATFVAVIICSVVAAAISAPPLAAALTAVATAPIGGVGKWVSSLWKKYEKELQDQKELIFNLQLATCINLKDLDNIRVLVDKLGIEIESLLTNADFALRDADILSLVIDEIRKKLDVFMEGVDNLVAHSNKYSREIRQARIMILRKITE